MAEQEKLKWTDVDTRKFPKDLAETLKLYGKADVELKTKITEALIANPKQPDLKDGYGYKYSLRIDQETAIVKIGYAEAKLKAGSSGPAFDPFGTDDTE
jgi:alanine racemase